MTISATVYIAKGTTRTINAIVQVSPGTVTLINGTFQLYLEDQLTTVGSSYPVVVQVPGPEVQVEASYILNSTPLMYGNYIAQFTLNTSVGVEVVNILCVVNANGIPSSIINSHPIIPDSTMYGDIQTLARTISANVPFTLSSASYRILKPGYTVPSESAEAMIDSDNLLTLHTVYSEVLYNVCGPWTILWNFVIGDNVYNKRDQYFVSYSDIHQYLRDTLRVSPDILPNQRIDTLFASAIRDMFRIYAPGYSYRDLSTEDDQQMTDEGVCLLLASQLRSSLPKSTALGEIKSITHSDTTFSYSDPYAGRKGLRALPTLEEDWTSQAWMKLSAVSLFSSTYDAIMANYSTIDMVRDDRRVADDEFANFVDVLRAGGYKP